MTISQCTVKSSWAEESATLTNTTPPVTAKQQVVIIPDQHEEGRNGYGQKDFEKKKVLRSEWKMS